MIIASVFDITILDCLAALLAHTLTQLSLSRSLSESADNNHECIRFLFFLLLSNIGTLRRERFRQFYSHFANAQSIFANQTREIFFSSAVLCQDGRVPA